MKRIVFTVTNDLTYDQRMNRICSTLQAAGYDITLIGFMKKRSVKLEQKPYKQIRLNLFFVKGKLFYLEYNFRLFWYLLFKKYDIYTGIDLDTLLPVFFNAKLKGKPCVYDAHEYFTELPEIVARPLIKKMWIKLERFLLPKIKYNYTVGNAIAEELTKKYKTTFEVIRNVPILSEDVAEVSVGNYILYQGALNMGRGLEALMEGMAYVNADLYIAGEGDLSAELRAFAAELPHKEKIRFLGYVRPADLKKYTNEAKIGINLVEHLGLSYYYSLSNKFFDYIHAGKPQVTMNFPEYKKLNDQYDVAVLIDEPEKKLIASAINKLLTDVKLYVELEHNTIEAKKDLNWQKESVKLIQFYKQIE
ncbi:MAG: glycosyltransferase [Chitinophagales bacterium]|nr:glycosyltransferase [Bacteroidota bacterium]